MKIFWEFLAGLSFFLYGMWMLEDSLKQLAGRAFKVFLRKHTSNRVEAIASGTVITALLQSSSLTTLMMLAFVGAGVITMRNALAVVLGCNLGTTITGWIVAALGFRFDIEAISFPLIAVAGLGLILYAKNVTLLNSSRFILGFGLLFLGLDFMKSSIEFFVNDFDFTPYLQYHNLLFVLIGFVITALIQSSSATMVITLSALFAGILPLEKAVSIVIGSELGTAIKILIGSIGEGSAKKRLALGNILFNTAITVLGFIFLDIILVFITKTLRVSDQLIVLVMFQTLINLAGIIIFFPFMKPFADLLERMFTKEKDIATFFIRGADPKAPEASIAAVKKDVFHLLHRVFRVNLEAFHIGEQIIAEDPGMKARLDRKEKRLRSYQERYDSVKKAEGEIISFCFAIRATNPGKAALEQLDQLIFAMRNAMYSAKGMKDVLQDRRELRESADDFKYGHYKFFQGQLKKFYRQINEVLKLEKQEEIRDAIEALHRIARGDYEVRLQNIYTETGEGKLEKKDISSLLNVNRQLYGSCKHMIYALRDLLLEPAIAAEVEEVELKLV